jgi:hypothetical protein
MIVPALQDEIVDWPDDKSKFVWPSKSFPVCFGNNRSFSFEQKQGSDNTTTTTTNGITTTTTTTYSRKGNYSVSSVTMTGPQPGLLGLPGRSRTPDATGLSGEVIIRRTSQDEQPSVTAEIIATLVDNGCELFVWDPESQVLQLDPKALDSTVFGKVRVTLCVPYDATLCSLVIQTTDLGVRVLDGLDLTLTDKCQISTVSGDIRSKMSKSQSKLASPRVSVSTTGPGGIFGTWLLHRRLVMSSTSGNINFGLDLQKSQVANDNDEVEQTRLDVSSASGNCQLTIKDPLWQGSVSGTTTTGYVSLRGRGLEVDGRGRSGQKGVASRSAVSLSSMNGNVDFISV